VDALLSTEPDPSLHLETFLAHLVALNPHDIDRICTPPQLDDTKGKGKEVPEQEGSDNIFIYESLRFVFHAAKKR
jgi:hypothetical protein